MTPCAAQIFSGITQARFNRLVQEAATSGIVISGNQGQTVVKHGLVSAQVTWRYDAVSQTLTLQYLNPGFLAPCDKVNGIFHDLVDSSS
jgi:hypothetical protein